MTLLHLGGMLRERRGSRGVREVAQEIGVSAATLSRVESGKLPDLLTFRKICAWLKINPAELLEIPAGNGEAAEFDASRPIEAAVHLRADALLTQAAAGDLAALILAAQKELARRVRNGGSDAPTWI